MNSTMSEVEAKALSRSLFPLGDQWSEICAELEQSGYGETAKFFRETLEKSAESVVAVEQLRMYWREYAKERLAGLAGPLNVLKGKLPGFSQYRSSYLKGLREKYSAEVENTGTATLSPQIEPTIRRFLDNSTGSPEFLIFIEQLERIRRDRAGSLFGPPLRNFAEIGVDERWRNLSERYVIQFQSFGFKQDAPQASKLVFRKAFTSCNRDFLFVDDSKDDVLFGRLRTQFAIVRSKMAIRAQGSMSSTAATFNPEDIVPGFEVASTFDKDAFEELCLAIDSNVHLADILWRRIDNLLH